MTRRRVLVLKSAFAFDPAKWRPLSGLRSSLGLALPIVLAGLGGHTAWGILGANGALNVALPNMNSVAARRLQVMLIVSFGTALLAMLGVLVGQSTLASTLAITLVATFLTLYGAGGAVNTSVGIASTNTLIVLAGLQLPPSSAPLSGLLVLGGGLLQTFLLAVVWPLSPRRRERSSVAQVYDSQAELLSHLPLGPETLPEAASLQEAWSVLGEARGHGWHPEHAAMRHALRVAEGLRAALTGYARADVGWREQWKEHGAEALAQRANRVLGGVLRQVAASVRRGRPAFDAESEQQLGRVLAELEQAEATAQASGQGEPAPASLSQWLRLISQLLSDLNQPPVQPLDVAEDEVTSPPPVWGGLWQMPRPSWESASTRHAVKYGLVLGLGTLLTRLLHVPHGYWLVLTAAVVLRQEYVTTLTRGLARLGGTLAGVLLAELLIWVFHPTQTELSWWSVVGAFLTFALFPAGYAAFSAAITLYVVFAIAASGLSEDVVVELRLALTLLGGLLALGAHLLYPTWQSVGTRGALQAAALAQRDYLDVLGLLQRHVSVHNIEAASRARSRARQLRLQAEGVVQASIMEPRRSLNAASNALPPARAQAYLQRLNANAALGLSLHARAGHPFATEAADLARAKADVRALLEDLQPEAQ